MENVQTCGKVTIRYPSECTYVCYCVPGGGCHWSVTCGTWTTSGVGLKPEGSSGTSHPGLPSATLVGKLVDCAKILQKRWKRPVIVPAKLRGRKIRKRTVKGTPEQIAEALGLQLGSKRKA
jgi:hypothetical protein